MHHLKFSFTYELPYVLQVRVWILNYNSKDRKTKAREDGSVFQEIWKFKNLKEVPQEMAASEKHQRTWFLDRLEPSQAEYYIYHIHILHACFKILPNIYIFYSTFGPSKSFSHQLTQTETLCEDKLGKVISSLSDLWHRRNVRTLEWNCLSSKEFGYILWLYCFSPHWLPKCFPYHYLSVTLKINSVFCNST